MRARDFIVEVFNQPYPLKWEQGGFADYDAFTTLPDGNELSIMFNLADRSDNDWGVEFHRNFSQDVTGEGDAQRVFATVLAAISQFIKKKKPDTLFFSAVKDEDPSGSRTKLYDRLVQRYATGLGYNLEKIDYPEQTGYKLTKLKQDINESTFRDHEEQLRDFIHWCVKKLKIKQELPRIRFQDPKEGPDQHRTGYYDDAEDVMWIYTGNRNMIDIMRTVAHELTHRKQHEDRRVHGDQAYPGSPIEQEADAVAGYLMKLYGKEHPEIIE